MMVVTFMESLTEIMSSFLLSSTSFQDQCSEIGYGIMLPAYMQCIRYSNDDDNDGDHYVVN